MKWNQTNNNNQTSGLNTHIQTGVVHPIGWFGYQACSSYKLQREDTQKKNNHGTVSKQNLPQEGYQHNVEFLLKPGYSKNSKGSNNFCHICGCKFIHTTHLLGSFCKKGNLHLNVSNARISFSNLKSHRIYYYKKLF